jgi:hypothetical protein
MHLTILEDHGNRIESSEASPFPDNPGLWEYLPEVRVPTGTEGIIQVNVMDCMGGIGRRWIGRKMGEEEF